MGRDHQIDGLPDWFSFCAKLFERVGSVEGVDCGVVGCAGDDFGDGRVHVLQVLLDEGGDGGVAFGDPRTFVKELSGGEKWGEVDLDGLATEGDEFVDGVMEECGVVGIAKEVQRGGGGDAKAEGCGG